MSDNIGNILGALSLASLTKHELRVRPDFPARDTVGGYTIILQADDEQCFYFDLDLLVSVSDFFRHLASTALPPAGTPLRLPSVTSSGLALALNIVRHNLKGERIDFPEEGEAFEALVVADAYDIPVVSLMLKHVYVLERWSDPFIAFALAAVNGDEAYAKQISKETCIHPFDSMDSFAERILNRFTPHYLDRLRDLHLAHSFRIEKLRHEMYSGRMSDGHDAFAKKCWKGDHCVAFRLVGGKFEHLRNRAAKAAIWRPIRGAVESVVNCDHCAKRLCRTFLNADISIFGEVTGTI